jgi:DNA-directed RNA polymerase beta' subunit
MDISSLEFGILSPADVLSLSVCEVKYDKAKKAADVTNTLYDPRMGPVEDDIICTTCKKTMVECPGHFGHIILNEHIIYPLPYGFKTVLNFLKCFCFHCSRLAFSREKLELLNLFSNNGIKRYNSIVDAIDKVEFCWNCAERIPKFFVQNPKADPKVMMFYKSLGEKKSNSKDSNVEVAISDIERVFTHIVDEDITLFGFNPHRMRPTSLILSIIPVLPPCSRPYVMTNGERCEDDLTTLYRDITKANARILMAATDEDRMKEVNSLSFYISVLMDNSKGRVKQPNGRPKKGIKERLAGKGGIPRGNLLGKRTNYSARTVVGGDPTLAANEIAVPLCISTRVTIPENVCKFNLTKLERLVNTGQADHIIRTDLETGEKRKIILRIVRRGKTTPLFLGDKVYRKVSACFPVPSSVASPVAVASTQVTDEEKKASLRAHYSARRARYEALTAWYEKSKVPRTQHSSHYSQNSDECKMVEQLVAITDVSDLRDGDRIVRSTGEEVIAEIGKSRYFKLQLGDEVHRHLQDGDIVLLNRQPTLHVGSMLAGRAKIQSFRRTIGTPLNMTTPQNMDYDGKHCYQQ